jgi:glyoxylase-like metal-dependent hydrolase (beta-lactamase superfamily II)
VFKYVTSYLQTDKNRLEEHPDIENFLYNTREGDSFTIENDNGIASQLLPIETPGHIDDHLCFLL